MSACKRCGNKPASICVLCEGEITEAGRSPAGAAGSLASRNIFEAVERILTFGGVAIEAGWTLTDAEIPRKLDSARENIEAALNAATQNLEASG